MTAKDPVLTAELKKVELKYISDEAAGFSRKKRGEAFVYLDKKELIKNPQILDRIKTLRIPPAWDKVWIAPGEDYYLQATGLDAKGRKQYIYHPDWIKRSQENKFNKMIFFGSVLPEIRKKVSSDMGLKNLSKEKLLATVVWLLEHTFIRVGNDEYARDNNSYGLTTLRNKHLSVRGEQVKLTFKGKSGVNHSISFENPKVAKILKECSELPGYEIFQYLDEDGKHGIDSLDVNSYLKALTGEDITAKDFRTWGGTNLSAQTLYNLGFFETEAAAKKNITESVKKVSEHLGNTPAVCRSYYIHPVVIDSYTERVLIPHFDKILSDSIKKDPQLTKKEYALLTLLQEYS